MRRLAFRPATCAAFLTVLFAASIGAQSSTSKEVMPSPMAMSAIPKTPAGEALREWLDVFNSGDSTRIAEYVHKYDLDFGVESQLRFRGQTGGFDLLSVERSEPRHIEFAIREHASPTTAVGVLTLRPTDPYKITDLTLQALGPNMPISSVRIDASERARVVKGAAALLDSFYVFPDVARRMGDSARARLERGVYDGYDSGISFARRLTDDFAAIAHDKHLNVRFSARAMAAPPPTNGKPAEPSADEVARERRAAEARNCSFEKVERLDGNIGYLKFDGFDDPKLCEETVAAAMTFLAGTRAMIIDLRENGGGAPPMVALISSYLFDHRTHLNDLWTRQTNSTEEFWTRDTIAGRRFGGTKPVYVLTSSNTFSGAEEFTNNLKVLKRATIVGETTGGGAHPVRGRPIDEHFMIGVPFARAINPVTHTNWEGTGVEPDVKVPAKDALATAERLIRAAPKP
jgi:retinol-binding protein 3